jgi:hypothetical protein
MKAQHSRFSDAPWFPKEETMVLVGGAGGIGSWTTLLLSRAGFQTMVFDFDVLEELNLAGQILPKNMIGQLKTEALYKVVEDFSGEHVVTMPIKYDEGSPTHNLVIAAFDNMEARKVMFTKWREKYGNDLHSIFIDGRLEAEYMRIFCIRGADASHQEDYMTNHLFEDSSIPDAPCTMKQTSHAAAMIASHIVGFFSNFMANINDGDDTRSVPYSWEYFIPIDYLDKT